MVRFLKLSAQSRDAFSHAHVAEPGSGGARHRHAVVRHLQLDALVGQAQHDARLISGGVPANVGQRLLRDPQKAARLRRCQRGEQLCVSHEVVADPQGRAVGFRAQLLEAAERGAFALGAEISQRAEQAAQLFDGATGEPLDLLHGLGGQLWPGAHRPPGRGGLHADERDVMRDGVVQVARDPEPLCQHGLMGELLGLHPYQLARAAQLVLRFRLEPGLPAQEQRAAEEGHVDRDGGEVVPAAGQDLEDRAGIGIRGDEPHQHGEEHGESGQHQRVPAPRVRHRRVDAEEVQHLHAGAGGHQRHQNTGQDEVRAAAQQEHGDGEAPPQRDEDAPGRDGQEARTEGRVLHGLRDLLEVHESGGGYHRQHHGDQDVRSPRVRRRRARVVVVQPEEPAELLSPHHRRLRITSSGRAGDPPRSPSRTARPPRRAE